jgi:hypothetical protein
MTNSSFNFFDTLLVLALLILVCAFAFGDAVGSFQRGYANARAAAARHAYSIDWCVAVKVDDYRESGVTVALSDLPALRTECERTVP